MKNKCIVVDLEGTLSNCDHRKQYLDDKQYDLWNSGLPIDAPIQPMIDFVSKLSGKYEIIVSTAKPQVYRGMVVDWLNRHCPAFSDCQIFMRRSSDEKLTSPKVKITHILFIQETYEIELFIDDREDVIDMVKDNNITGMLAHQNCNFKFFLNRLLGHGHDKVKKTVADYLRESADIFEERNKMYGGSYKDFGNIMKALFPAGIHIDSAEDMNRFGVLHMMASKLHRYCANFHKGGHSDSLTDLSTYSAMLNELDSEL